MERETLSVEVDREDAARARAEIDRGDALDGHGHP